MPSRFAPLFLALTAACSSPPPAVAPSAVAAAAGSEEAAEETLDFDPAEEREQQPFESINGLRGPALSVNGLRLRGERGLVRLMVSAYDDGRDIVFQFLPRQEIPADWLAACPPSSEEPGQPRVEVTLRGVGDLSGNVLVQPDYGWSTSLDIARYVAVDTLHFEICGASYALEDAYRERLAQHVRMSARRAVEAYRQDREEHEQRCSKGKREACLSLAEMLLFARGGNRDIAGARGLYLEQCESGSGAGCLGASTATLVFVQRREEEAPRYSEAVALAVRACGIDDQWTGRSCWRAAILLAAGYVIPADPKQAQQSADAACQRRFQPACEKRGELLSCAKGQAAACVRLADGEAASPRTPNDGAEMLWRRAACSRGHAASCQD